MVVLTGELTIEPVENDKLRRLNILYCARDEAGLVQAYFHALPEGAQIVEGYNKWRPRP